MKRINKSLLILLLTSFGVSPVYATEESEEYIKPLEIARDVNSVDLISGKYYPKLPVLSIPAAPNLSLESMQQFDSKFSRIQYREGGGKTYSLTFGGKTSEYFKCDREACTPSNNTGSVLLGGMGNGQVTYFQGKTGIIVTYSSQAHFQSFANDPHNDKDYKDIWYATKIYYPDGEELDIHYTKVNYYGFLYHRPEAVVSNLGYTMTFLYFSNNVTTGSSGWSKLSQASIYDSGSSSNPLARHTFSGNGQVSDLSGRTWTYDGFSNALGAIDTSKNYSMTLPGDSISITNVSSGATTYSGGSHTNFVTNVVNQGKSYNYVYQAKTGSGYDPKKQFSKVSIYGPEGYQRTIDFFVSGYPKQTQKISADTDAYGNTTSYTYTSGNLIETVTFPEGNKEKYVYDDLGNLIEKRLIRKPGTSGTDIVYSAYYDISNCNADHVSLSCYRPAWIKDANGNKTDYTFDPNHGGMLTKTEPAGKNGTRRVTTNTYETLNGFKRLTKTSVCGGSDCGTSKELITEYDYWNDTNLPEKVTKTNGVGSLSEVTHYSYYDDGRLESEDGPLAGTNDATYYRYDLSGRKTWDIGAVNQQGARVAQKTTYRSQDNQAKKVEQGTLSSATDTTLSVFLTTENTHTTKGLVIKSKVFSPTKTESVKQITYNNANQEECIVTRMNPLEFNSLPESACILDTPGEFGEDRIVKHTYDALSRITKTISGYGTEDAGVDIEISYTDNGQVYTRKDGNGNTTTYGYDGFDRLNKTTFPDLTYEFLTFDSNSNLKTLRKRDGKILTHYYDGLNQKESTSVSGESSILYDYDKMGRQDTITRGSNSVSYTFDGLGRTYTATTNGKTLTYLYDAASRRERLTHPDGFYVKYAYDNTGALTSIKEYGSKVLVSYIYNTKGQLTSINRNNGVTSSLD